MFPHLDQRLASGIDADAHAARDLGISDVQFVHGVNS
jgi:hypothetical protein